MWCAQDVQKAMMMTVETTGGDLWLAPMVLADHGSEGGGGGKARY